jgi:hypothetical protein
MTSQGTVRNGVVVLEGRHRPADGTPVSVRPRKRRPKEPRRARQAKSLNEALLDLAGSAGPGLPRDLARNHDHYLYGTPKRK